MRFSKIENKNGSPNRFFSYFRKTEFQRVFLHDCTVPVVIVATLKNFYANRFIQMTKHCSSDWDTSVVFFLHWTRTVSR